jgi:hypothetical protein
LIYLNDWGFPFESPNDLSLTEIVYGLNSLGEQVVMEVVDAHWKQMGTSMLPDIFQILQNSGQFNCISVNREHLLSRLSTPPMVIYILYASKII